jgi:large subunit ribosomal protein L30
MGLYLVLNLHGKINSPKAVRETLRELKVERKFTATVVPDDGPTLGALKSCKDFVAWTPLDKATLATLLEKRGMVTESKHLDAKSLSEFGYGGFDEMAEKLLAGSQRLSELKGVRPFFRLSPPRGGFRRSLRRQYSEGGMLGKNPKLPEVVGRML